MFPWQGKDYPSTTDQPQSRDCDALAPQVCRFHFQNPAMSVTTDGGDVPVSNGTSHLTCAVVLHAVNIARRRRSQSQLASATRA